MKRNGDVKMNTFRVTFDNGDMLVTRLNGTIEDARHYYLGHTFNLGTEGDDMHLCTAVTEVRDIRNALDLLDELDEFRRTHQNERQHPSDWCMRVMEAIVAVAVGYSGRNSWTSLLAADENSKYYRDLKDSTQSGF